MKKILLALALGFSLAAPAQTISNIVLSPAMPDDNDTLKFYVYLDFPYMGCAGSAVGGISGNTITASALHCMGMLSALCSDVDTVIIPPQPAGNYHFYFTLSAGYGGPPCSPGIVPNDKDTLDFSISSTVGVNEITNAKLEVFPNPSGGNFFIRIDNAGQGETYLVQNTAGAIVYSGKLNGMVSFEIENGLYIISVPSLGLQQRLVVVK